MKFWAMFVSGAAWLGASAPFAWAAVQVEARGIGWGRTRFDTLWSSEPFVAVTGGGRFTVAQRANGELVAWGLGVSTWQAAPTATGGLSFVELSAGGNHALALRSDNVCVSWGPSPSAQLSNVMRIASGESFGLVLHTSGTISLLTFGSVGDGIPSIPPPPPGLTYIDVGAGDRHALALRSDGSAVAWGWNSTGQTSVPALPPGRRYTQLAGGYYHSVGLVDNGSVQAWGLASMINVPALPSGVTYTKISACSTHSLALRSDGNVVEWPSMGAIPPLPPGVVYVDIATGGLFNNGGHSLALRSDGRLARWGANDYLQVGPPAAPAGVSVAAIDAGQGDTAVARLSNGTLQIWGSGPVQMAIPTPPAGVTYAQHAVGYQHVVALRSNGTLASWGVDTWGGLHSVPSGSNFVEVAAGSEHSLARRSNGTIATWGITATPAPPLPSGVTYVQIDADAFFNVALRSDGAIAAWGGDNLYGEHNPPAAPQGTSYTQVRAAAYHGLALRSDGNVVMWGASGGALGSVPPLPAGTTYVAIAANHTTSAALRSDGVLRVWGESSEGQAIVPALAVGERFAQVSVGAGRIVAVVEQAWTRYCAAKVNSLGCTPAIGAFGSPSASLASGFTVIGSAVRNDKLGLLFYTVNGARTATPFQCGTLCIGSSNLRRAPLQSSGGAPAPADDCSGVHVLDLNAFGAGALGGSPDPGLRQAGSVVRAQWWGRDPGFPPPCSTTLTDALEVTLAP